MTQLLNRVRAFVVSEEGPTATEYAIMLALIAVVCLVAISGIGTSVANIFTNLDGSLPTGSAP